MLNILIKVNNISHRDRLKYWYRICNWFLNVLFHLCYLHDSHILFTMCRQLFQMKLQHQQTSDLVWQLINSVWNKWHPYLCVCLQWSLTAMPLQSFVKTITFLGQNFLNALLRYFSESVFMASTLMIPVVMWVTFPDLVFTGICKTMTLSA